MQVSRETEYAIRCLEYLSREPERTAMTEEIAANTNIPRSYLAKILQKLSRARLVASVRGAKGGFRLAKLPNEISLYDLFLETEGPVAAQNTCAVSKLACGADGYCSIHSMWTGIREELIDLLRRTYINDASHQAAAPARLRRGAAK